MLRDRLRVLDLLNKSHPRFDVTIVCCLAVTALAAQKTVSQRWSIANVRGSYLFSTLAIPICRTPKKTAS